MRDTGKGAFVGLERSHCRSGLSQAPSSVLLSSVPQRAAGAVPGSRIGVRVAHPSDLRIHSVTVRERNHERGALITSRATSTPTTRCR